MVGQIRDVRQAFDRRFRGARPRVDDDSLGANLALAAAHDAFARERCVRANQFDSGLFQFRGDAVAPLADDASDALHDGALIDTHFGLDAEALRQARAARVVGRRQKRFRGRAAIVDATSAEFFALEQDDAFPACSGIDRQRDAALAAPDDDEIDIFHFELTPLHDAALRRQTPDDIRAERENSEPHDLSAEGGKPLRTGQRSDVDL